MTLYNKVYSIGVDDQSPVGQVSTRDLDPFGSGTNESLGLFGGASISDLYPYYLTLDPQYQYLNDAITLHFHRSISDVVSVFDATSFKRHDEEYPDEYQLIDDRISSFDINKVLSDAYVADDSTSFAFNKQLDTAFSLYDNIALSPTKYIEPDYVSLISDNIEAFGFGKGLFDTQESIDLIQSFIISKYLEDYANPVDLVSIPDGSTFQLHKTLRNTILLDDKKSFTLNKQLENDDAYQSDLIYLLVNKYADDYQSLNDHLESLNVNKALFDDSIVLEDYAISLDKILDTSAALSIDLPYLNLSKPFNEYVTNISDAITYFGYGKGVLDTEYILDGIQSFNINKLLKDYANPVDLVSIPDGSTFQLHKTLRSTVSSISDEISSFAAGRELSNESEVITDKSHFALHKNRRETQLIADASHLVVRKPFSDTINNINDNNVYRFTKALKDLKYAQDLIQSFYFEKRLKDYANPVDLVSIPDGSTFQLHKTLRNTVNTFDLIGSIRINKIMRDYDVSFVDDTTSFDVNKPLIDHASIVERKYITLHKEFADNFNNGAPNPYLPLTVDTDLSSGLGYYDFVTPEIGFIDFNSGEYSLLAGSTIYDTLVSIVLGKAYYEQQIVNSKLQQLVFGKHLDNLIVSQDSSSLRTRKNLQDVQIAFDAIQPFSIRKLLKDYANPVDLVSIPDGSTFQLHKTLRNTILLDDNFYRLANYNRSYTDSATLTDAPALNVTKAFTDYVSTSDVFASLKNIFRDTSENASVIESLTYDILKSVYDLEVVLDSSQLNLNKLRNDYINQTDNETLIFDKVNSDFAQSLDSISSLNISKQFYDYANPVDLVSIPDGSTFQLHKTLRNTISLQDSFNRTASYIRSYADVINLLETASLNLSKSLFDAVSVIDSLHSERNIADNETDTTSVLDTNTYSFNKHLNDAYNTGNIVENITHSVGKSLTESIILTEVKSLFVNKPLITVSTVTDQSGRHLSKPFTDTYTSYDAIQPFVVSKFFRDYANPIDLVSIPDGSTYSLIKSLRNTISLQDSFNRTASYIRSYTDHETILDQLALESNKSLSDRNALSDSNLLDVTKVLNNSIFNNDSTKLNALKKVNDNAVFVDVAQRSIGKYFADYVYTADNTNIRYLGTSTENAYEFISIDDKRIFIINKAFSDKSILTETISKNSNKSFTDNYALSDIKTLSAHKHLSDSFIANDTFAKNLNKSLYDVIIVNDNQNITTSHPGSQYQNDITSIEDYGSLYMTDYADITYFAEDYVGESRTFT